MLTLSSDLEAAQLHRRRRPALAFSTSRSRFGVPLLLFSKAQSFPGADHPQAAAAGLEASTQRALYLRNNAGTLEYSLAPDSWTTLDSVTAGQGFALAWEAVADHFAIVYGDGNDLKLRTFTPGTSTLSSSTTLVTEASPIGAVAIAAKSNGDLCAFYALGTSTTVKRLRRTAGAWAGSGTTWTRTADVASVTGLSAVHSGNFYLAVTGTEVTTTHERLWSVAMGDGPLPANAWSGLVPIAEADAAAALTFHHPHLCYVGSALFCTFMQTEAGNVAAARAMLTHTTAAGDPLGFWREPFPPADTAATLGVPLIYRASDLSAVLFDTTAFFECATSIQTTLTSRVLSASWRETPDSLRVRVELELGAFGATILPGQDVQLVHGLTLADGSEEFGVQVNALVSRVSRKVADGKATVLVEADGPWEALARYRAPAAWTAPAGYTRAQIFSRLAARAGINITAATGPFEPSSAWSTDTPLFAVAAGETGRATLLRLLAPTPDFLRLGFNGGFEIVNGNADVDGATFDHPQAEDLGIFSATAIHTVPPAWVRLQAEDRYADSFAFGEPETNFALIRDFSAIGDAAVEAAAAAALLRGRLLEETGQLVAPIHLGLELFDIAAVNLFDRGEPLIEDTYRIIGRGLDFKRGPAGGPTYNSVLTLAQNLVPPS